MYTAEMRLVFVMSSERVGVEYDEVVDSVHFGSVRLRS